MIAVDLAATQQFLNVLCIEVPPYRALGRGFDGGDPTQDWLMAEAHIDEMPHD